MASYKDRLRKYQDSTGLIDAVLSGHGTHRRLQSGDRGDGFQLPRRHDGVGRRRTNHARDRIWDGPRCAVIIVSASGGARMYEGMLSLMQMAKTSGALARHAEQNLPYISVLTNPTTAGVMASFASLGDVIIAEPRAWSASPAARDQGNDAQDLPEGFQTAEFLEEHGLIDLIVHRKKMRAQIAQLLAYFSAAQ